MVADINDFPEELLGEIFASVPFGALSRMANVSRPWRRAAYEAAGKIGRRDEVLDRFAKLCETASPAWLKHLATAHGLTREVIMLLAAPKAACAGDNLEVLKWLAKRYDLGAAELELSKVPTLDRAPRTMLWLKRVCGGAAGEPPCKYVLDKAAGGGRARDVEELIDFRGLSADAHTLNCTCSGGHVSLAKSLVSEHPALLQGADSEDIDWLLRRNRSSIQINRWLIRTVGQLQKCFVYTHTTTAAIGHHAVRWLLESAIAPNAATDSADTIRSKYVAAVSGDLNLARYYCDALGIVLEESDLNRLWYSSSLPVVQWFVNEFGIRRAEPSSALCMIQCWDLRRSEVGFWLTTFPEVFEQTDPLRALEAFAELCSLLSGPVAVQLCGLDASSALERFANVHGIARYDAALERACSGGRLEVVAWLLRKLCGPEHARAAFVAACEGGNLRLARWLVKTYALTAADAQAALAAASTLAEGLGSDKFSDTGNTLRAKLCVVKAWLTSLVGCESVAGQP